ncbi:metal-dependent hydrolase [Cohnella silvisoli]|uniref:Metal-dependent hydrolase n=1 Tax=Cohnella silvisoli TaxID=2873699 RepID=A0ABV1KNW3_9BACL|nr:metal-dependent hydrolase [Cohnella silvisoli]MCD9020926.1 metal-dependent hydrolase [Cohnella silvisoli]
MKGSTHLAIGGVIGAAACLYYPFQWENALMYVSVAGVSALSADLDGQNLLSGKLSKLSHWLRELAIWTGLLTIAFVAYMYFAQEKLYPVITAIAVALSLLGFVTKEGTIRNVLVSLIGCVLLYSGWTSKQNWLMGFGLFVVWVPWLDHRGMTHTVWALFLWGAIGMGLEKQLGIDGITIVSVAGYASHLLADTLTPNGVKWLYPLYKKSIKIPLA